jgi:hypothetical protein
VILVGFNLAIDANLKHILEISRGRSKMMAVTGAPSGQRVVVTLEMMASRRKAY